MLKPVSRGTPPVLPPRPVMMLRNARAFMSITHFQVTERGSMSGAPSPERRSSLSISEASRLLAGLDRLEVAHEMEVDVFHRDDLRAATAGGATLHAEAGTERGFAQHHHRFSADAVESVAKADRGGRLALAGRGRRHCGDQDQLAPGGLVRVDLREGDLGLEISVRIDRFLADPRTGRDFKDRIHANALGDFQIAGASSGGVFLGRTAGWRRGFARTFLLWS